MSKDISTLFKKPGSTLTFADMGHHMNETIAAILLCLNKGGTVYFSNDETGYSDIDRYRQYTVRQIEETYYLELYYSTNDANTPGYKESFELTEDEFLNRLSGLPDQSLQNAYLKPQCIPAKSTLYTAQTETINVLITAGFDPQKTLVVEGCDSGESVKAIWDDWDYEYSIKVSYTDLPALSRAFLIAPGDLQGILNAILGQFAHSSGFSAFKAFLSKHHIPYQQFSWA